MVVITVFLTVAGFVQTYLQRYSDEPQPFMAVQEQLTTYYWMREIAGGFFLIGLLLFIYSFFAKGKEVEAVE